MAWQIKGESGATLNTTLRTLASIRATAAQVRFQSLAADTFTWTATTDNATGAGTIVPDLGQLVILYKDSARKFYGWVTKVAVGTKSVAVEVQGPWWWMQRIYLNKSQSDANGGTATRTRYVFPTGDLRDNVLALLDRGIANGVPMIRATSTGIAEMYDCVKITLSNMTIAAALAKLMARLPDGVVWFDYSTDGELPKIKIARRGGADAAATLTFDIGTDIVEDLRISPRLDLEVSRVELPYMDRHPTTGKPRFQAQTSGTAATGKVQIITVSGPEIVDFLPKDDFESANVKTVAASAITNDFIVANDPTLASIKKQFGMVGAPGTAVSYYTGSPTSKSLLPKSFPPLAYQRDNGAFVTSLSGKYLVISSPPPQWVLDQYGGINVTITGTWIAQYFPPNHTTAQTWSKAFEALKSGANFGGGYHNGDTFGGNEKDYEWYLARPFSCRGVLLTHAFPSKTKVYKAWDYDFIEPPSGMASGLRQAQNWVPWEGPLTVVSDDVSATSRLDRVINITGTLSDCATMKALLKGQTCDLLRGRTTYLLGAPARTDFATAMGRVPTSPQDVIEYIG